MSERRIYRFGPFEFDSEEGELRRHGFRIPLEPQPAKVLEVLLERSGRAVTREDLQQRVWGEGTFVDFERGLAYCVGQVRSALGDTANAPRYVETLPRRGFRFVAPVELESTPHAVPATLRRSRAVAISFLLLSAAGLSAGYWWTRSRHSQAEPAIRLAVAAFDNETGVASLDPISRGLSDAVVARLASLQPGRLGVIGNAAILQRSRTFRDVKQIGRELSARYVVLGQVQLLGAKTRVIVHLIRTDDEVHLWAKRFDRDTPDWFALQSEISEAVATAVSRSLIPHGAVPEPPRSGA